VRTIWSESRHPLFPLDPLISKTREIDFENVAARIALRHSQIFAASRNPFTAV
jgi:hypothetical protein